jgi:hypothetical protein
MVIFAQVDPNFNAEPKLKGFHILPTIIFPSGYDYMSGAYDGRAIQIQEQNENIPNPYIIMTYQGSPYGGNARRQRRAWVGLNPSPTGRASIIFNGNITTTAVREGFGTMALDPVTGTPFFVWHSELDRPGIDDNLNCWITYEHSWVFGNEGDNGYAINYLVGFNEQLCEEFHFAWPVAFVGPSPLSAEHRRLYVFMSNGGYAPNIPSRQGGNWPSSAVRLTYADFTTEFLEEGHSLETLDPIWVTQTIPYFDLLHNFNPGALGLPAHKDYTRAFPTYTVQRDGSGVALVGANINGIPEIFQGRTDGGPLHAHHDNFVIYSSNYGEVGSWREITFNLEGEPIATWQEFPWLSHPDRNGGEPEPFYDDTWPPASLRQNHKMAQATLNHKSAIFDTAGRIHYPAMYSIRMWPVGTNPDTASSYSYWPNLYSIHNITIDPREADPDLKVFYMQPRPLHTDSFRPKQNGRVSNPPRIIIPWDFDGDNIIDLQFTKLNANGNFSSWYEDVFPYPFHDPDLIVPFHVNHIRMTEENNGAIAMMWMDATKSGYAADGEDGWSEWLDTSEIMITVSLDMGNNWSMPLRLSTALNPEFVISDVNYISYLYPADKLVRLDHETVRLYFMYTNDHVYGPSTERDWLTFGQLGCDIAFAAVDIRVSNFINELDVTLVPMERNLLSQNYPNPFNPTTTINYLMPVAGKVNISVYNIKGQLVKTLIDDHQVVGNHSVVWDGDDSANRSVASGVYFYKIETNGHIETRKMVLLK